MADLAQVRADYPELAGRSDDELVDVVQKAIYPDMSREDVAKAFGVKEKPKPVEKAGFIRRYMADPALSLAQGAIGVGQAAVGGLDLVTGGHVGKFLENKDGAVGYRPDQANEVLQGLKSEEQQAADKAAGEAFAPQEGDSTGLAGMGQRVVRGMKGVVENPSVIPHQIIQSGPAMLAGGGVARGILKVLPRAGAIATGAGEGLVQAGQQAEQTRADPANESGLLDAKQTALTLASGLATGGISAVSNGLARKLGFETADNLLSGVAASAQTKRGFIKQVLGAAMTEGFLEELPQSIVQQVTQNAALGKPLDEGLDQQMVMGVITGATMGAGAHAAFHRPGTHVTPPADPAAPPPAGPLAPPAVDPTTMQPVKSAGDVIREDLQPGGGPLARAVNAGVEDTAEKVDQAVGPTNMQAPQSARAANAAQIAAIRTLPPEQQDEALGHLTNGNRMDIPPAVRRYAQNRLDQMLAHAQPQETAGDPVAATEPDGKTAATPPPTIAEVAPPKPGDERDAQLAQQQADATELEARSAFEQRNADKPAPAKLDTIQSGDVMGKLSGAPFKTMAAAMRAHAQHPGSEMVNVEGGIVIRPQKPAEAQKPAAAPAPAPAAAPAPAPAPAPAKTIAASEIKGMLGGIGKGISDGFYDTAYKALAAGKTRMAGVKDPVLAKAKPAFDAGAIKSAEDLRAHVEAGYPTVNAPATAAQVDAAAHEAATSPTNDLVATPAQLEGNNAKLGHVTVHGLDVSIEHPKGSTRTKLNPDGSVKFAREMTAHYGYVKGTTAADGDHVDAYIGPKPESDKIFVVDQTNADGSFDEHKLLIGYPTGAAARASYASHYPAGFKIGAITPASPDRIKEWLNTGDMKQPYREAMGFKDGATAGDRQANTLHEREPAATESANDADAKPLKAVPKETAVQKRDRIRAEKLQPETATPAAAESETHRPGEYIAIKFPAKAGVEGYTKTGVYIGEQDGKLRVRPNGGQEISITPDRVETWLGHPTGKGKTEEANRKHAADVLKKAGVEVPRSKITPTPLDEQGNRTEQTPLGPQVWVKGVTIEGGAFSGSAKAIAALSPAERKALQAANAQRLQAEAERDAPKPEEVSAELEKQGDDAKMPWSLPPEKVLPKPARTIKVKDVAGPVIPIEEAKARIESWKAEAKRIGATGVNKDKVVFSLFDRTGQWSQPYVDAGYDVRRYDIDSGQDLMREMPTADIIEAHESGKEVVGVLAAPPCTSFSSSGSRWWADRHDAPNKQWLEKTYGEWAPQYFDTPLDYANTLVAVTQAFIEFAAPSEFHVVENPVGRIARQNDLPKPLMSLDPNYFGDPYTKKTLLWGVFKTDLPVAHVEATEGSKMHNKSSSDWGRSETPEGFAYAFFMANHGAVESQASAQDAAPAEDPAERDWSKASPDELDAEIQRLSTEERKLMNAQRKMPEGDKRQNTIRAADDAGRQRSKLQELLPSEDDVEEAPDPDLEPDAPFEPGPGWRDSMFYAREYARHLGINPNGMELKAVVKAIDKAVGKGGGPVVMSRPAAAPASNSGTIESAGPAVSTRVPTSVKAPENYLRDHLLIGLDAAAADPKTLAKNAAVIEAYPNYREAPSAVTVEQKVNRFIEHVKDNLLWLHDQIAPETRNRSKLWYDGARHITDRWVKRFGLADTQVAGVLAVQSPQKDWFMNVSLAERIIDAVKNQQTTPWSKAMDTVADRIWDKPQYLDDIALVRGKTLAELEDPIHKSMWIRTFDQAHNSRNYRLVTPEGGFGDFVTNADGKTRTNIAWATVNGIAKAVSIIEDGSRDNVSAMLGGQHKVHSFFNNIVDPNGAHGSVTIDTHAVAAGLLRPLSGASPEVEQNFGGGGSASSAATGSQGTYGIYAEAYRRAAEERGVLPREMQSITWEAVRGLFTAGFKSQSKNVDAVAKVWENYRNKKLSLNDARNQITELAGRINDPDWIGSSAGTHEGAGDSSYARELPAVQLSGRGAEPLASRVGSGVADRASVGPAAAAAAKEAEHVAGVNRVVDRLLKGLATPPRVWVLDSQGNDDEAGDSVPQPIRDRLDEEIAGGVSSAGYFFNGEVFLIAHNLQDDADVVRTFMHEALGHLGLRAVFGKELGGILDRLAILNAGKVRTKAVEYGLDYDKQTQRRVAAEEVLAEMAGNNPQLGWVQKAVAAIRTWFREHVPGYKSMKMSDAELIQNYLVPARNALIKGNGNTDELQARAANVADDYSAHAPVLDSRTPSRFTIKDGESGYTGKRVWNVMEGDHVVDAFDTRGEARDWVRATDAADRAAPPPPVLESRVFDNARTTVSDWRMPAGYKLGDFIGTGVADGKLSWWQKSVGTPFHLAQKSALFKPVYDGIQSFLGDVSRYANAAADRAPTLVPKLDGIGQVLSATPPSADDTKAFSAAVFAGTLKYVRDAKGNLLAKGDADTTAAGMSSFDKAQQLFKDGHVSEAELKRWQASPLDIYDGAVRNRFEANYLKAGVVFSDAELKDLFKLNDKQIGMYREALAAVNQSLDDTMRSGLVYLVGQDITPALRQAVLENPDADAAAIAVRDFLYDLAEKDPARADALNVKAENAVDMTDRLSSLKKGGYFPLSRFGTLTLDVVAADGTREWYGHFEDQADRAKRMRELRTEFPDATITQGTVSQEAFKQFAGINPETAELFGEFMGLGSTGNSESDAAFQKWIALAKSTRSAMQRLQRRKGIAGYSEDATRTLAGFITSNARHTSSNLHMDGISRAKTAIPKEQGELRDYAEKLSGYVGNPADEATWLRGIIFAQQLAGSIAGAMINATQSFTTTLPRLSMDHGIFAAARALKDALVVSARNAKKSTGDVALDKALKEYEHVWAPQEIHQLMGAASARGSLLSGDDTPAGNARAKAINGYRKFNLVLGKTFSVAEQFNRRMAFISSFRLAMKKGMDAAAAAQYASGISAETQFTYNKGNKPVIGRTPAGAVAFTFKQYTVQYLELMQRMWTMGGADGKKAALLAIAIIAMLSGADGLPFAENVDDVIDGVMSHLGYDFQSKRARHEFFAGIVGEHMAGLFEHGLSAVPGVPMDVAGRFSMGKVVPGMGLLVKKTDHTSDVAELAGPVADIGKRALQAAGQIMEGNIGGAFASVQATWARNLVKGIEIWRKDAYLDSKGNKVIPADGVDAFFKAIGFQPQAVARIQRASNEVFEETQFVTMMKAEMQAQLAKAISENDSDAKAEVRRVRDLWNERNPEARITLNMAAALRKARTMNQSKDERLAKTAPKAIREEVRDRLREATQ